MLIKLKRSSVGGARPSELALGELALNVVDARLFFKAADGRVKQVENEVDLVAGDIICGASDPGPGYIPADGSSYGGGIYPQLETIWATGFGWTQATKLPVSIDGLSPTDVAWSGDQQYLAITGTAAPYLFIYKVVGETFTYVDDLEEAPPSQCQAVSFSENHLVAVGPNLTIYKRDGETFTKLPDPSVLPISNAVGCAFSQDGQYLAIGLNSSPYLMIYKVVGDTFTSIPIPSTSIRPLSFSWANGSQYLALAGSSSYREAIFERAGDNFTLLAAPEITPTSNSAGVTISEEGQYLVSIGSGGSGTARFYRRDGNTLIKLGDPDSGPTAGGRKCMFSSDGRYVVIGSGTTTPYIWIYRRDGDTFTKLGDPDVLPGSDVRGVAFSPDDQYLAVVHIYGSSRITIYKNGGDLVVPNVTSDDPKLTYWIRTGE